MSIIDTNARFSESIGFDMGCSNNIVQSKLLDGFFSGLWTIKTDHSREMQLTYIATGLNDNTIDRLLELCEHARLAKDDRQGRRNKNG